MGRGLRPHREGCREQLHAMNKDGGRHSAAALIRSRLGRTSGKVHARGEGQNASVCASF